MKSAPFTYVRPASVEEALHVLDEQAGAARILAGGQSLVPMLQMRLMQLDALVDINRLPGLDEVRAAGAETIFGPLVRYATIERLPLVAERLPLLQCVMRFVGDPQIRNRGTIGGSLAQADPTGEVPLSCLALDATIVAASVSGTREILIDDFLVSSYTTALEPGEMITEIRFPLAPHHFAFLERNRKHNDFAVVNVAVVGRRGSDGGWSDLRIALGGVSDRVVLAVESAALLEGTTLEEDAIAQAAQLALDVIDPPTDVRGTAEYRRHLVPVYVRRALSKLRDDHEPFDA
ncbi:MAG: xanthine dehydrogenase family protein subunit M [Solirubrobacterales bacterium]|nr:xanthine dehydrogenase family protein subunit M [Solirubrobacterales bacterium]MBV9164612.1 xanthine dehydrogenase family protein subunit M [Solirubrobacterales bacterium]MBV9534983.1 xanthine dehydrogenase family protein subunit M [Solirubrobacterales bacterium]